ncbi:aminotransferase class I/II-fold pyridoxal phosphate-dependent enzyme [Roseivirga sp. E12]|uniref:aminotransferase class I/II-fold pyridoxal phosphate-dependent enzyme n=1 Tax=Roseivirga sp. E12 TaxID=2819237 RepID=UPI001ABC9B10|nr:aminotransferase class I/II-fold pyridoxal phosphate-dependent enzyme [Roseivirga sp. E12]MBO3699999.1 aminotransferase class I/II-fold pyridoxal phosphate-dependent enzyme [Roseivirga sp. E12]
MDKKNRAKFSAESLVVADGHDPMGVLNSLKNPIFQTSTFMFNTAEEGKAFFDQYKGADTLEERNSSLIYTRLNHPNLTAAEFRLAQLDGAEDAAFFESGMAAISTTIMTFCKAGDLILMSSPLYGGTDTFIKRTLNHYDVEWIEFDSESTQEDIEQKVLKHPRAEQLKMIYVETPANPTLSLTDIGMIANLREDLRTNGIEAVIAIDNTYLGPIFQKPISQGADLNLYSATKYIGGHSDVIAGACSGREDLIQAIKGLRTTLGCMASPFTSWLVTRSLETVALRMEKQASNAEKLADFLKGHSKVEKVYFLGHLEEGTAQHAIYQKQQNSAGAMMAFEVTGLETEAFKFLNSLELAKLAVSLGSTETLASHPYTMSSSNMNEEDRIKNNITESLIRISVGIENPDDLISDFDQALNQI